MTHIILVFIEAAPTAILSGPAAIIMLLFGVFILAGIGMGISMAAAPWLCFTPALAAMALRTPTYLMIALVSFAVVLGAVMFAAKIEVPSAWLSAGLSVAASVVFMASMIIMGLYTGEVHILEAILLLIGIPICAVLFYPTACFMTALCAVPTLLFEPKWFLSSLVDIVAFLALLFFIQSLSCLIAPFIENSGVFYMTRYCNLALDCSPQSSFLGPMQIPYAMQNVMYAAVDWYNRIPAAPRLIASLAALIGSGIYSKLNYDY